ncbi:MAG: quinone-dependent dihydroorotate dehydrogenase [Hyphomicrobiaceae bacterium]|nr:quinone-dependent dihydroorotate dehydrogenase [Hyphomicrobiaceae bacterium]
MLNSLFDLARPALLALDPERAHDMSIEALERGLHPRDAGPDDPRLAVRLAGLAFSNPVGIAAGFDKDARVPDAVLGMGCGFAEIGTVTPLPQPGNPKPRVFRLIRDRAVINRLGFNNQGHEAALRRLQARRAERRDGIVGVNIGANKDTADRSADYVSGLEAFYGVASYFTVNISSPNTPGLRDLQAPAALDELLGRVMAARSAQMAAGQPSRPIFVKIAPDIAEADIEPIAARLLAHRVDAVAVSNTTLARPGLSDAQGGKEVGGLSGRPLFHRSTVMLARVWRATEGKVPLIGIGGIDSPAAALAKIEAGATLIQLYTGLIYEGAGLIGRIKRHLADFARTEGLGTIREAAGRRASEWAAKPIEG